MVLTINSDFIKKSLNPIYSAKIISLPLIKDTVQYNPTQLFEYKKKSLIALRAESTKTGRSKVLFYEKKAEDFVLRKDFPKFNLEDPFISIINNKIIFGGVEIKKVKEKVKYRTLMYEGKSFSSLKLFFKGPYNMKDIRLVDLNGKIGVFTRPQGGIYKRGQIGFMLIDSLKDLEKTDLYKADIILDFQEDYWGGVNQAFVYKNKLCVIAHFAYVTKKEGKEIKHYVSVSFEHDYVLKKVKNIKLLCFKKDFSGLEKFSDIVFPGGVTFTKDSTKLFVGISDSMTGYLEIKNPF